MNSDTRVDDLHGVDSLSTAQVLALYSRQADELAGTVERFMDETDHAYRLAVGSIKALGRQLRREHHRHRAVMLMLSARLGEMNGQLDEESSRLESPTDEPVTAQLRQLLEVGHGARAGVLNALSDRHLAVADVKQVPAGTDGGTS